MKEFEFMTPRRASLIGLVLIGLMVTLQLVGTRVLSDRQEVAAIEINLAGRQRMLSQRIALLAERVQAAPEKETQVRGTLLACVDLMERSHVALVGRDAGEMRSALDAGQTCLVPSEQSAGEIREPAAWDISGNPALAAFTDQARQVAQGLSQQVDGQDIRIDADRLSEVLGALNADTLAAQEKSIAEVRAFLMLSWVVLLALIAGVGVFLFRPMARSVDASIARLREANASLSKSEARFRDYASTAAHQVWETDEMHRFSWVGAPGDKEPRAEKANFIGKPRWDVGDASAVLADVDWAAHRRVLNSRQSFENFEYPTRTSDGKVVWWRVHGRPMFDSGGRFKGYRGASLDITKEKTAEFNARHSERMRALGQLTAGVAHDFNNLLSVVQGNAELIALENDENARRRSIAEIVAAVERGASLTSRLLAFGRVQTLKAEAIEIGAFFEDMSDLLNRTLGEEFTVRFIAPEEGLKVFVDRHQLEDALVNLALNARDACVSGGRLNISARAHSSVVHMPVAGRDFGTGELVCITFEDNGCGIEPAALSRIFEPFYTTKPVGKGSGLGLSMVYGFALQSGGFVEVDSKPNQGTSVSLYLPMASSAAIQQDLRDPEVTKVTDRLKVLLLEDNLEFRAVAKRILEQMGHRVWEAGSGKQALDLLKTDGPFDLLLADIVLPGGLNGVETARDAQRRQPGLAVIYSSGFTGHQGAQALDGEPGAKVLMKPYRREQLMEEILRVTKARAPSFVDKRR